MQRDGRPDAEQPPAPDHARKTPFTRAVALRRGILRWKRTILRCKYPIYCLLLRCPAPALGMAYLTQYPQLNDVGTTKCDPTLRG